MKSEVARSLLYKYNTDHHVEDALDGGQKAVIMEAVTTVRPQSDEG